MTPAEHAKLLRELADELYSRVKYKPIDHPDYKRLSDLMQSAHDAAEEVEGRKASTDDLDEFLPPWATGRTDHWCIGAQLCTRDGRRIGNAVIESASDPVFGKRAWSVVTDAGTQMVLTEAELGEFFWPPRFVMDPSTSVGRAVLARFGGGEVE